MLLKRWHGLQTGYESGKAHDYRRFPKPGNKLGAALAVKPEIGRVARGTRRLGLNPQLFFVDNLPAGLQWPVPKINNIHKQKHAGNCNRSDKTKHA
ncbi:MAG: hypothetical protein Q7T70_05550 [Polaromonas sp.]|nr:hypothetical protein [Polaromonas sp.]